MKWVRACLHFEVWAEAQDQAMAWELLQHVVPVSLMVLVVGCDTISY